MSRLRTLPAHRLPKPPPFANGNEHPHVASTSVSSELLVGTLWLFLMASMLVGGLILLMSGCTQASYEDPVGTRASVISFWTEPKVDVTRTPLDPLCPFGAQVITVHYGSEVNTQALAVSNQLLAQTLASVVTATVPIPPFKSGPGGPAKQEVYHPCPAA